MSKIDVYQKLKEKIIKEEIKPGRPITEREISELYGISRTPARELLWQLASNGFVQHQPKGGYSVTKFTLEQIIEIFQTREGVEGMAARLACQKGSDEFFAYISELRKQNELVDVQKDAYQGVLIGRKMHNAILKAAHNSLLLEFYEKLQNLALLTSNITKKSIAIEEKSKEYHIAIMRALEARDQDKSEQLMREHLRITCRLLIDTFYPDIGKKGLTTGFKKIQGEGK